MFLVRLRLGYGVRKWEMLFGKPTFMTALGLFVCLRAGAKNKTEGNTIPLALSAREVNGGYTRLLNKHTLHMFVIKYDLH